MLAPEVAVPTRDKLCPKTPIVPEAAELVIEKVSPEVEVVPEENTFIRVESASRLIVKSLVADGVKVLLPVKVKPKVWSTETALAARVTPLLKVSGFS